MKICLRGNFNTKHFFIDICMLLDMRWCWKKSMNIQEQSYHGIQMNNLPVIRDENQLSSIIEIYSLVKSWNVSFITYPIILYWFIHMILQIRIALCQLDHLVSVTDLQAESLAVGSYFPSSLAPAPAPLAMFRLGKSSQFWVGEEGFFAAGRNVIMQVTERRPVWDE